MKTVRILSILGLFIAFLGFYVAVLINYQEIYVAKWWGIIVSLNLAAQGIVSLAMIKLKKKEDRIDRLEKTIVELQKALKEK